MPNQILSSGKIACLAISLAAVFSVVSRSQPPANDAFENQQRAIRILQFDKDIATLPDAEIRALLRLNILEFIYSKQVLSQYTAAEPVMSAFFEDIAINEKSPNVKVGYLKSRLAVLLRKYHPELAARIETKYAIKVDTMEDDFDQIRRGGDVSAIVDRAIGKMRADGTLRGIINVYESARRTKPEMVTRMLNAALDVAEKNPSPDNAVWLDQMTVNVLNPPNPEIPSEQMLRYYKILLIAARGELVRALPKDYYIRTLWPLRRSLSSMEKADPRMAAEAIAIFIGYRKFLSKEQVLREEADDRIEAADDKLARAITEAESASDVNLKDYLWYRAATIALPRREGDRKKAIDLLMKAEPTLGTPGKPDLRDQTLRTIASRGGAYQDYEGARYAVERIKNENIRIEALLYYLDDYGRMNSKDRQKTAAQVDDAIKQLEERAAISREMVCPIGNLRALMTSLTGYTNIRDLTARTVRIMNKIPFDGSDSKPGSPERTQFYYLSRDMIGCAAYNFRPVWDGATVPPAELADGIKVKEWRLAAQIEAEKYRKYSQLPQTSSVNVNR